jgi:hypothetical protein
MEVASQGRVSQGQGTGEATVLDTSQFYNQMYNIQKDIVANQEKKRKEYEQQQATWNSLLEDMPDVWQSDYEYVNKAVNEYNDFIVDLKSQGIDPDTMDSSLMRKAKELENNIRKATSAAKDNETYYNQSFNILNQDKQSKYNKDHATQWLKDYADPNKSPQDRAKLRNESNPFKLNYDLIEFIDETIPKEEVVDSGRKKVTSRNKEAHRSLVLDYIMNDAQGKEIYDSLKKPGETVDMFAERVSQEGQNRYPKKTDVQPAPQPKDSDKDKFKGGYGTGNWNDKLSVSSQVAPNFKSGVSANTLYVTRTGTNDNVPPIQTTDATGQTVNFQPVSYHLRDDGAISVLGEVITGTGQDQVRTQTWMDYDANKAAFQSQLMGMDLRQEFNARNSGTTGAAKSSSSKSTETPAQRAARIAAGG